MVELRHAVVELVVAGDDDIVAAFIHDIDERLTLRNRAHHFSLYGVARVYKRDVFVTENAAAVGNIACQRRIAQRDSSCGIGFADCAVHVVGVQDDHGALGGLRVIRKSAARQAKGGNAGGKCSGARKKTSTGKSAGHGCSVLRGP